eukprot:550172_1
MYDEKQPEDDKGEVNSCKDENNLRKCLCKKYGKMFKKYIHQKQNILNEEEQKTSEIGAKKGGTHNLKNLSELANAIESEAIFHKGVKTKNDLNPLPDQIVQIINDVITGKVGTYTRKTKAKETTEIQQAFFDRLKKEDPTLSHADIMYAVAVKVKKILNRKDNNRKMGDQSDTETMVRNIEGITIERANINNIEDETKQAQGEQHATLKKPGPTAAEIKEKEEEQKNNNKKKPLKKKPLKKRDEINKKTLARDKYVNLYKEFDVGDSYMRKQYTYGIGTGNGIYNGNGVDTFGVQKRWHAYDMGYGIEMLEYSIFAILLIGVCGLIMILAYICGVLTTIIVKYMYKRGKKRRG